MGVLGEIEEAVATVATAAGGSVVGIGRLIRGSGVIVGAGTVLTNAHNLRGQEVTITFADGRSTAGQVAGVDADGDLAVVSVDTAHAPIVAWADGEVSTGRVAFAAAAGAGGTARITFGLVTGTARSFRGPRGRRILGSIEHTAPLARGSSGGPLLDEQGRLLGINTNRLGDGFYLAIPADPALRQRVDALASGESAERPRLGVAIAPAHVARRLRRAVGLPERDGLLIRQVEEGSPAAGAGLQAGDLLVAAAGRDVTTVDDLWEALDGVAADGLFEVRVVRGAEERRATVSLATGTAPDDPSEG